MKYTHIILVSVIIVCLTAACAFGFSGSLSNRVPGYPVDVTVQWEAVDCPDIRGYRVYMGNTDPPAYLQWEGRGTSCEITLESSRTYYFGVCSVDIYGNEDRMSPVFRYHVMPGPEQVFIDRMVRKVWLIRE